MRKPVWKVRGTRKQLIWAGAAVVFVVFLAGVGYWYMHRSVMVKPEAPGASVVQVQTTAETFSGESYAYVCDTNVTFSIAPSKSISTLKVSPTDGSAFPPSSVLKKKPATVTGEYVFEGNGVRLIAKGVSVTIAGKDIPPLECSPKTKPNQLPLIFGN